MSIKNSMIVALSVAVGTLGAYGEDASSSVAKSEQSFESFTTGTGVKEAITDWDGYGSIVEETLTLPDAGAPIQGNHTKNLAIEGWVTAPLTVDNPTSGDRQLDMLVKVALPEDALEGMNDAEAKFAIAVDTDKHLKYYTGTEWKTLGYGELTENNWIRVAILFDSTNKKVKISVNGEAAPSGPWFDLLNKETATTIASLKVVGTTALDDLVVKAGNTAEYKPEYKDASGNDVMIATGTGTETTNVPLAWFDKNNVPTSVAGGSPDESGMTTEDKYITGVAIGDNSKFELKTMSLKSDSGSVKAEVELPAFDVAPGYKAVLQTSSNNKDWTDSAISGENSGKKVEVTLASGNVTYIRLSAVKDSE